MDVERAFSKGRIVITHLRNRLAPQTTRSLLCLQSWSPLGLIKHSDVIVTAKLAEIEGDDDVELEDGWDDIID